MCDIIIPDLLDQRNPTIIPCPTCSSPLRCARRRLSCPACGWSCRLAADESRDLADALAGLLPDLRVDVFVAALSAQ